MSGPYETGSDVTRACLECHEDAGEEMLHSEHWLWENPPVEVEGHDEPVALGKKNSLNNFCLGIQGNEATCTSCHAGYGWEDDTFDVTDESNIDCLVCHDSSGAYAKDLDGYPAEGSDLLAAAQSVGAPTRDNCGTCHFDGGGGNGVKHGDPDGTLIHPNSRCTSSPRDTPLKGPSLPSTTTRCGAAPIVTTRRTLTSGCFPGTAHGPGGV